MATISINHIAKAIYKSSLEKKGGELDNLLENTVQFLAKKKLLNKSEKILASLQQLIDKDEKVARIEVTSSEKLSKHTLGLIEEEFKKRHKVDHLIIETKEDKRLIGGFKIEWGDEVIDLTLSHQLNKLQNYLIEN